MTEEEWIAEIGEITTGMEIDLGFAAGGSLGFAMTAREQKDLDSRVLDVIRRRWGHLDDDTVRDLIDRARLHRRRFRDQLPILTPEDPVGDDEEDKRIEDEKKIRRDRPPPRWADEDDVNAWSEDIADIIHGSELGLGDGPIPDDMKLRLEEIGSRAETRRARNAFSRAWDLIFGATVGGSTLTTIYAFWKMRDGGGGAGGKAGNVVDVDLPDTNGPPATGFVGGAQTGADLTCRKAGPRSKDTVDGSGHTPAVIGGGDGILHPPPGDSSTLPLGPGVETTQSVGPSRHMHSMSTKQSGGGVRPSAHHASSIDMPTGPSSHEVGGDEGHGHNPHAPGPHQGGQIMQQQSANTNMFEEHGDKGARTAHGDNTHDTDTRQPMHTQVGDPKLDQLTAEEKAWIHEYNEDARKAGWGDLEPVDMPDFFDKRRDEKKRRNEGKQPAGPLPGGDDPDRRNARELPPDDNTANPLDGGNINAPVQPVRIMPGRDERDNLTKPQEIPKDGQLEEDLHFRAFLPEMRDDLLVRPVGSAQKHKDQFTLFDFHQRDNEFASLGNQLDDDFYQQRLREDAIRYKEPLNAVPLEFKGSNIGFKPGDDLLRGYGSQPRKPDFRQFHRERFVNANKDAIMSDAHSAIQPLKRKDNEWKWGGVHEGTYFPNPLCGIMHDQMRENINFNKSQFIANGPVAAIDRLTNFDKDIKNPFDLGLYNHRNRNHWDKTSITGSYPWDI
jgi:hypothetical protein